MYTFKNIREILLQSLPVILLYFLCFNSFEGIKEIENAILFSFNLQLIIVYIYSLKFPEYLGSGHIFFAGIINDVVLGTPLGSSSLSYLTMCFFSTYIRNVTLRSKMTTEWFTFIPAIFFANVVFFVVINNFSNLVYYYVEILRISFFTFLFFPIFYFFFSKHQRQFKKD